ncbi:hypothetical protein SISSUDRAFT_1122195 [Sistotremastrum suecicum HHB10207 ss-3]|uniref:Uncharacterized protein n=1 Tax=Sistotremastrum suecicum HHB10207 ss-3 TaxID=1314776 RepID=A0A165ZPA6_9AGAM|nr:hypothetical protein SISSUDRAFT_1122195 [Sistotremastrum suecicum HHB10207 ss-3]
MPPSIDMSTCNVTLIALSTFVITLVTALIYFRFFRENPRLSYGLRSSTAVPTLPKPSTPPPLPLPTNNSTTDLHELSKHEILNDSSASGGEDSSMEIIGERPLVDIQTSPSLQSLLKQKPKPAFVEPAPVGVRHARASNVSFKPVLSSVRTRDESTDSRESRESAVLFEDEFSPPLRKRKRTRAYSVSGPSRIDSD